MNTLLLLLQINVADTTATIVSEGTEQMTLSFWELALKGGWIMIPILLLSVIAIYIFVDRYIAIRNVSKDESPFMNQIKQFIYDSKVSEAMAVCKAKEGPVARMIEKGINQIGRPMNDIHASIENVGKQEIYKLEKGLATLATTAGAAPMIGFLGTVIGMIRAFYDMSTVAGGNINVTVLSNGIYTAMVTTVAGLIVGIVAYFAYNILVARVEKVVYNLEASTSEFMDLLKEPASN